MLMAQNIEIRISSASGKPGRLSTVALDPRVHRPLMKELLYFQFSPTSLPTSKHRVLQTET